MASSSVTSRTTFATAIVLLLLLVSTTEAQQPTSLYKKCDNKAGNYTTNSTFISNLQSLLQALTSNATTTIGFSQDELGSIPDRVYGLVLCRGDVDNTTCRSCLSQGSQDVLDQCPSAKAAAIWYDYCFLRYSNTRFASNVNDNYRVYMRNVANVTSEWPRFNQSLVSLLGQLRRYAAYNTSAPPPRMFATGLIRFNNRYPNITALEQCTRDLTPDQCNQCVTDIIGNYTTNSTFISNLQSLLQALTSNATTTIGFSQDELGSIPDRVYGLVLCRGDVDNTTCRSCLSQGSQDVLDQCPSAKAAAIWYDYCFLRYSNTRFASNVNDNFKLFMWFNQSLVSLLGQLRRYAAYKTSAPPPRMFATGLIRFNNRYPNITALVQCTRDLTPDQCNQCLTNIIGNLPNCCNPKIGGRVLAQSCNFRYEVYNFSKKTSRISLPAIEDSSPGLAQSPSPPPLAATTPSNNSNNTTDRKGSRKIGVGTIVAIVISLGVALLLLITFICCLKRRKEGITTHSKRHEVGATKSLLYDLATIRNATNDFSEANKLGEGGFGVVYQGKLEDGEEIAVKKLLPSSSQGIEELKNEVVLLAKLQHRNLVKLLGLCLEGEEKMLIYEYMQNKSLERFLFDHSKKGQLHWEKRYNIICGIARGLLYLHEESRVKIIHRDLKASNILLDLHMNPKISDFGLARLFGDDQTEAITTRVVGTFGYMPPEYAYRGQFSNKSDVFGFGVLVLEIVTGRKNNEFFSNENSMGLLGYVWEHWSNGTVLNIMDSSFARNYNQVEALRCIQIGLLCVQEAPSDRPTMSNVILMLNSHSVSIHAPTRPAFLHGLGSVVDRQNIINNIEQVAGGYLQSTNKSVIYTPNELSITELDAR